MRKALIERKTGETDIRLNLTLEGSGESKIITDCGFFNHMMELFARHGNFDLELECKGDSNVDMHHSIEDIGICLGRAFDEALGDKRGICRYGSMILPMDEALIMTAVDFSGRDYLNFDVTFPDEYKVGDMDVELVQEFLLAFVRNAKVTLHVKMAYGSNVHHIAEGIFKSLARTLKAAVAIDASAPNAIPSTKGVL